MSKDRPQFLWDDYHEKFGEWFPTMCFQSDTREDITRRLQECLDAGQKAEELYGLDPDVNY